jgi:ABC-type antimicrobial peptide transport system permease subunit
MLKNYLKSAFRNIIRYKDYSLIIIIALATVCYQALKAAHANPVDALKYE